MKELIGFLLLIGLVLAYWQWVLAAVVLVVIVKAAPVAWRELQDERTAGARRRAELAARADEQHGWALTGDERGLYGAHPPANLGVDA